MVHTDYLTCCLDRKAFEAKLREAKKILQDIEFYAFAVSGNSGTLFGGALATRMRKGIFLIRKPGVDSHGYKQVEGDDRYKKYLFLDDQIASGATAARVLKGMDSSFPVVECVGRYIYGSHPTVKGKWVSVGDPYWSHQLPVLQKYCDGELAV